MNKLYPLKFKPIFKDKIWGGQKIRTILGMDFSPLPNCGEVWVLSGYEGSQSVVSNGFLAGNEINELVEVYMDDLVGETAFEAYGNEFPILVKFIDSNEYLSIQVHPDDELAALRHNSHGKNEMWYIVQADEGAELISGFNRKIDRDIFVRYLQEKNLKKILNVEKVYAGDVFNIPTGRIHSLGPGILLTEIQQTSDLTYRVYDWDRVHEKGLMRELHVAQALDAIDYNFYGDYKTHYVKKFNRTVQLIKNPWFTTNLIHFDQLITKDYGVTDSFVIYLCLTGEADVLCSGVEENIKIGEAILIPAVITSDITLVPKGETKILEVYVED